MRIYWLAILFLSFCWYSLSGIYEPTHIYHTSLYLVCLVFLLLSFLLPVIDEAIIVIETDFKIFIIFSIASLLSILMIPAPYNYSVIILFSAVIAGYLSKLNYSEKTKNILRRISSSGFISGCILGIQSLFLPVFYLVFSRYHNLGVLHHPIKWIFDLTGLNTAVLNDNFVIKGYENFYIPVLSWDSLGLFYFVNIFIGAIFIFSVTGVVRRYYKKLIALILIYMAARYIFIMMLFLEIEKSAVFWKFDITLISFLPIVFILYYLFPIKVEEKIVKIEYKPDFIKKHYKPILLIMGILFFSVMFFGFSDPGFKKNSRILIDEKHSDWEWSTQVFDTTWYGHKSTYNYYCLAEYLSYFYKVDQKRETLNDELLDNYDILMIKTPTEPFSGGEIEAIKRFVSRGGGLFLVGDHTNVFGITTNLNPIAEVFGFKYRYDGQYDIEGPLSVFERPKILPHPVIQKMPKFMFATGCMLEAPVLAENGMVGYGIKSIKLDYSQRNFFPENASNNENMEFGLFLQAAGGYYGKGRIFLFTDSTVWSNFFMFMSGKSELLIGIIDWLNRENSVLRYMKIFSLFFVLLFTVLLLLNQKKYFKDKISFLFSSFILIIFFLPLSIVILQLFNNSVYSIPVSGRDLLKISFDLDYSQKTIPIDELNINPHANYENFYVSTQRLGIIPRSNNKYCESLIDSKAAIIINPKREFSSEDIRLTKEYLETGGNIILIDDSRNSNCKNSNSLLKNFNLMILNTKLHTDKILYNANHDTLNLKMDFSTIVGGNILLYSIDSNNIISPLISYKEIGKGKIVVISNSELFSISSLGSSSSFPNREQEKIYKIEYMIFRDLLKISLR